MQCRSAEPAIIVTIRVCVVERIGKNNDPINRNGCFQPTTGKHRDLNRTTTTSIRISNNNRSVIEVHGRSGNVHKWQES